MNPKKFTLNNTKKEAQILYKINNFDKGNYI